MTGGSGSDTIDAGPGNDLILARDGKPDRIAGGPGRDRAPLDRTDRATGIEVVIPPKKAKRRG